MVKCGYTVITYFRKAGPHSIFCSVFHHFRLPCKTFINICNKIDIEEMALNTHSWQQLMFGIAYKIFFEKSRQYRNDNYKRKINIYFSMSSHCIITFAQLNKLIQPCIEQELQTLPHTRTHPHSKRPSHCKQTSLSVNRSYTVK